MKKIYFAQFTLVFCILFLGTSLWAQTFNYTGAMQTYTVPAGITSIQIEALGAGGASFNDGDGQGGRGTQMIGDFAVTPGQILDILVGGQGTSNVSYGSGGGGGSFVVDQATGNPMIIAGGGGGIDGSGGGPVAVVDADANILEDGFDGYSQFGNSPTAYGLGGTAGGGGGYLTGPGGQGCAGNGGGFFTDGVTASCGSSGGGLAYVNGGTGGVGGCIAIITGGYGGGGGSGCSGGGGGGGYSGGGASWDNPTNGGGGGSFNTGTSQNNLAGINFGDGQVIITVLCAAVSITPDLAVLSDTSAMCSITPNAPTATNNCGVVVNGVPDTTFPLTTIGTTVVTWTYDDGAGNITTQTQNVIVSGPDVSVTVTGAMITSNALVAAYQWLDCDNNYAIIAGETNQNYTPTVTGNYAVEVTAGGCTDTSACTLIDFTGVNEIINNSVNIYPNPTDDVITVEFEGEFNFLLYNNIGQIIKSGDGVDVEHIELRDYVSGTYHIRITSLNQTIVIPLIKK